MNRKIITTEIYQEIHKEHLTGLSVKTLGLKHGIRYGTLYYAFQRLGLVIHKGDSEEKRRNPVNDNWFETIDCEEKAYYLGLLMADGYVNHRITGAKSPRICIKLEKTDRYLVEQLQSYLQPGGNTYPEKNSIGIQVVSTKLVEDLFKLGLFPNKTTVGKTFTPLNTDDLQWHFIRGYFDGDGSISTGNQNRSTIYICCSTVEFLKEVEKYLDKFQIKTSLYTENRDHLGYKPMYTLHIKSRVLFYQYLYKDASIFMQRKRLKYNHVNTVLTEKSTRQRRA